MRRTLVLVMIGVFAGLTVMQLAAASRYVNLVFEAEQVGKLSGKAFKVMKQVEDASGKVSEKKVLAIPKLPAGTKVPKDEVSYTLRIPQDGAYYLWARVFWSTGCGNSFFLRVEEAGAGEWILGGDATYDAMHWICLTDGGDNSSRPRPLRLKKGMATLVLGARESGTRVDQFLLTTDRAKQPASIYKATKDLLVIKDNTAK
jgi:hypothetical protein